MICNSGVLFHVWCFFFFQAEDGIRDLVRSRGLGDVYKRQDQDRTRLEHREIVRVAIDDGRDAAVGIDLQEPGLSLIHI